ncbi:MAG: Thioredoxin [Methanomassiliicoccales archaeon PtaU1.Bin124]|nr:MAG: Thioredoxin [Methanomassiliicoccales archaeon PtaU1.Bin124]
MVEDEELEMIRARKLNALMEGKNKGDVRMAGTVEIITDATFESFIKKDKLVVIDCWAPWCGPCRALAPKIEELSNEMADKISFGKLNTDENEGVPMRFNISAIPTLLIFKNGNFVDRIVGSGTKEFMKSKFEKHL